MRVEDARERRDVFAHQLIQHLVETELVENRATAIATATAQLVARRTVHGAHALVVHAVGALHGQFLLVAPLLEVAHCSEQLIAEARVDHIEGENARTVSKRA